MLFLRNIFSSVRKIMSASSSVTDTCTKVKVERLQVEGMPSKFNDILFTPPKKREDIQGRLVFFGGDVQDYPENMQVHRDNKHYLKWNLENTAALLHRQFPQWEVYIVKPCRMQLKTFSCYDNFVKGDNVGSPQYSFNTEGLLHLKSLLTNATQAVYGGQGFSYKDSHIETKDYSNTNIEQSGCEMTSSHVIELPIILIGFSKGTVVLNQLLYSFYVLDKTLDNDLFSFVKQIKTMYWLDGGHSGGSNTWIIDKKILSNFVKLGIEAIIHVTPYQIKCAQRPWVGKEEKIFQETLKKLGAKISRTVHFETEERSLKNHFQVLEEFTTFNCNKI
ncbi:mitochondrial protein C2orf69 homolog [Tachypleus tridentatus]|uniref:mitochondrial protein C2orf69 homolog n=1 Tax=Tachypleus tridentatus TaxID=6853 RepID=UPI003FD4BFF9